MIEKVFNPLDKISLAESIEQKLLEKEAISLAHFDTFVGAGIYAIYYSGDFPPYQPISRISIANKSKPPIYVGKAVPKGSRKGGLSANSAKGSTLYSRIKKHSRTVSEARNLKIEDFHFRHLVVDDVWIPLGENILIENFQPIWNVLIDGFGNNAVGSGRTAQKKSSWDTLHPGRGWADALADFKTDTATLVQELSDHFSKI